MSIGEQFDKLIIPNGSDPKLLHAVELLNYPFAKVGVNYEGMPVILISSTKQAAPLLRNYRHKYIELNINSECRVSNGGIPISATYSLILFRCSDASLIKYFFSIISIFLESLALSNLEHELLQAYQDLIEIFRSLNETPVSTIQGLWSELFLIDRAKMPEAVLACWHSNPRNKFDFEAGTDKLEIKSTRTMSRLHTFSAEQLNVDENFNILIASIFIIENEQGKSVKDLMHQVENKLGRSTQLFKLQVIAAKTLGAGLQDSANLKYDESLAASSLRFYDRKEIDKIESQNIPNRVSEVHFKSDLSMIRPVSPNEFNPESYLFGSL